MVMCGGPPRRSRPICAETVSVTSAGRAPRERRICWERQRCFVAWNKRERGLGGRQVVHTRGETWFCWRNNIDETRSVSGGMRLKCKSQCCGWILSGCEWRRRHTAAARWGNCTKMQNGRHFGATAGHFEALLQMMARHLRGRISEWQTKGARPRVFMMDAFTIRDPSDGTLALRGSD